MQILYELVHIQPSDNPKEGGGSIYYSYNYYFHHIDRVPSGPQALGTGLSSSHSSSYAQQSLRVGGRPTCIFPNAGAKEQTS